MTDLSLIETPGLKKRRSAEKRFKAYGLTAICISLGFLALMFANILFSGLSVLTSSEIGVDVTYAEEIIDPQGGRSDEALAGANYKPILSKPFYALFEDVQTRKDRQNVYSLLSVGAVYQLQDAVVNNPNIIGTTERVWVPTSSEVNMYLSGKTDKNAPDDQQRLSAQQRAWLDQLSTNGHIRQSFNSRFFTNGDSREPELAGIRGAFIGSMFTLLVCFAIAFPIGICTAVYLEEFARKNWFTDLIEVNINNLAAVPSIVFGLLGLSVFLNVFNLPRSTPLVGGMVLALMTLPTIIIASRASLRSVPPSIRQAAMGLGASQTQTAFHHTVPLAMPGILTGTIIGMSQALGQTAPLILIGMVAFIVDIPGGVVDVATALPVQIFLWADSPEKGFNELTYGAIIVLLAFLVIMNMVAVVLRRKLERRW